MKEAKKIFCRKLPVLAATALILLWGFAVSEEEHGVREENGAQKISGLSQQGQQDTPLEEAVFLDKGKSLMLG